MYFEWKKDNIKKYEDVGLQADNAYYRVALIVPACQPGWEEMENVRGNFIKIEAILGKSTNFERK